MLPMDSMEFFWTLRRDFSTSLRERPVIILLAVAAFLIFAPMCRRRGIFQQRSCPVEESREDFRQQDNPPSNSFNDNGDVWSERKARGIIPSQSAKGAGSRDIGENVHQSKPFGSSYYYAHNNPNAKGGYKDGLRMEDYTMNGPRLLSKRAIDNAKMEVNGVLAETETRGKPLRPSSCPADESTKSDNGVQKYKKKRVIAVTQYLWDDPGTGIASIRIDRLPDYRGTFVAWKEAKITQVVANLLSPDSLVVVLESESEVDYRLHLPKLFGPVDKVSCTFKPNAKRLLIKLEKQTSFFDKSNAKPWPHPHKKQH